MRIRFGFLAIVALAGCAPDASVSGVAIRDPLGLIDDVFASGNDIRLYVLPAESYACTPSDGAVLPEVEDLAVGLVGDAIVDISLSAGDIADRPAVEVPAGAWTVLVRGKGTDSVSGRTNVVIAQGCASTSVEEGGTVEVAVMLAPRTDMGMCGDMLISPDEQCETGAASPECGPDCRTRQESINTTVASVQARPRVATRSGQRVITTWESDGRDIGLRLFDPSGRALTGPLAIDVLLDDALASPLMGAQASPSVAVAPDGSLALPFVNITAGERDVRIAFFSASRTSAGPPVEARTSLTGLQASPSMAYAAGGASMVVFEDAQSATGLSGRVFAAGATTPSGTEAFPVGTGRTGGAQPIIAASLDGFVVAFVSAGDIFFQRFSAAGAPTDASAVPATAAGTGRDQPSVATTADGTMLIAWTEANAPGDLMGTGIRAQIFGPGGAPGDAAFTVNTTLAGDQSRPSVAASGDRFLVAFESAGAVRAIGISATGAPSLNRERPPAFADFEVAPVATAPSAVAIGTGATAAWWVVYQAMGDMQDVFARRFPL